MDLKHFVIVDLIQELYQQNMVSTFLTHSVLS